MLIAFHFILFRYIPIS